ncbi:hypothetical protein NEOLEDRAFT_1135379 [Neolentinus lepideus HHB14362 ss-1]|uniref:Uncharacterized protein n=1 Tax=Neolentinus lepideus HHB14362 ss-1 TaxID=1314782 RepID=A0A165RSR9_9AGAM|nr:hypothetical protein NEOLEDRAFT_1135379 [Neolentinus lepideus HHB14362 ss-1]
MSDHYIPLTQVENEEGKESDVSLFSYRRPSSISLFLSPLALALILIALLAVNFLCLALITKQVKLVSEAVTAHIDFRATRDLPRPDPYDGVF